MTYLYTNALRAYGVADGSTQQSLQADVIESGVFPNEFSTKFDGSNEYATAGDVAALSFERTDAFSISAWVRTTDADGAFVAKQLSVSPWRGYALAFASGKLRVELNNAAGSNWIAVASIRQYNDGQWHHVVMTYSGSSTAGGVKLYVDGKQVATGTAANNLTNTILTTAPFTIGGRSGDWFLASDLDEVGVFSKELTAAEVTEIYNDFSPTDLNASSVAANLVGWWRMGDDATFPTIADESPSGNDATLTNMEASDIQAVVPVEFYPTDVPNCVAFWDAERGITLSGGGTVSSWDDANGSVYPLSAGGTDPTLLTNEIEGRAAVRYDGAGNWMQNAALNLPTPSITNTFYFGVVRQEGWGGFETMFSAEGSASYRMALFQTGSSPQLAQNNGVSANANGNATLNKWVRLRALFTGSTSDYLRCQNTQVSGASAGNTNAGPGVSMGSRFGAGSTFWQGSVGCYGIWSGQPSTTNLLALDNWVANKFGLTSF